MRVIQALGETAGLYPNKPAVADAGHTLSYRELWEEARLLKPDPGSLVIQEPRSCLLVVKLLAYWMAGLSPLLLDPATPPERVREMLAGLSVPSGAEYLVSTSGSTGLPKVVAIGEGSLHHVLSAQIESFKVNSTSRVGWMLSPGFDASLSDIGTALCSGACLVCSPDGRPDNLDGITHLDIPPSLLQVYRPQELPDSLETLVVGGEPTPPEILREWARHYRLFSVYGPSETTVCSSLVEVDAEWDRPYLGLPIAGVLYRVENGELLIGGPTVGLGYLDSAEPFPADAEGVRWYRSGDLVGCEHDKFGWSFLGRKDRQVQLRGQRLEPEEVERRASSILGKPAACEIWNGQVVLFWERGEGSGLTEEDRLKEELSRKLMPAWVPQHYLALSTLPRNRSHKVDREQLRQLADRHLMSELTSLDCLQLRLRDYPIAKEAPRASPLGERPKLLLTGATGRLGSALVPHLESDFEVWSLQRQAGGERTYRANLTEPDFGLSVEQWAHLQEEMECVLHLAATVDLRLPLESLLAANVAPVARLRRLGKPIHYASTMAVALCQDVAGEVVGGYPRSKWLAERELLDRAGLTIRYGHLIGRPKGDELLAIVVRGLLEMGCCPVSDDPEFCFDWTPLEWAAEETARLLLEETERRQTVVLNQGLHFHLNDLAEILHRSYGVRMLSASDFARQPTSSRTAELARQALGKCLGGPLHPAFDLFLLGNNTAWLEKSSTGPPDQLETFVATVAAAVAAGPPPLGGVPAPTCSLTHPCA
ncbi:MAG: AMP-binding protein [Candidatus Eremiobacteraeota bacterium]|nr:AMP-binding protein [Candidatus Eremiobacteraeota bacterium]